MIYEDNRKTRQCTCNVETNSKLWAIYRPVCLHNLFGTAGEKTQMGLVVAWIETDASPAEGILAPLCFMPSLPGHANIGTCSLSSAHRAQWFSSANFLLYQIRCHETPISLSGGHPAPTFLATPATTPPAISLLNN